MSFSSGRVTVWLVLGGLLLTVSATLYLLLARAHARTMLEATTQAGPPAHEARRLTVLLTVLLVAALLVLAFALGAYLVVRTGRLISRPRVGGTPTPYVDAWRQYRLTDDQIAAALGEDESNSGGDIPREPGTPPDTGPPPTGS